MYATLHDYKTWWSTELVERPTRGFELGSGCKSALEGSHRAAGIGYGACDVLSGGHRVPPLAALSNLYIGLTSPEEPVRHHRIRQARSAGDSSLLRQFYRSTCGICCNL